MSVAEHKLPMVRDQVAQYLPHRDPMQFIDSVTGLSETSIEVVSEIRSDAVFFQGHFPGLPILPGVLIIETLAQAGSLLVSLSRGMEEDKFIAFTSIESAKFKRPVFPGNVLKVTVDIQKIRGPYYKFSGKAYSEDLLVASALFSAAQMSFDQSD